MKKILALVLSLVMVFSLVCVGGAASAANDGAYVYWLNM